MVTRKPPYRTSINGYYTKALFWEPTANSTVESRPTDIEPIFSLNGNKKGLINARETFVELEDPTGYKWSQIYLASWDNFELLKRSKWFAEALEEWRAEIDVRIQSRALDKIKAVLNDPDAPQAQVVAAAKYLANGEYKPTAKKGRPTKEEVTGELKLAMKQAATEDDDAARIGLRVIK